MLIKTAGVTTKRISMEHTYTKEVAEKKGIRKQNSKEGKRREGRITNHITRQKK